MADYKDQIQADYQRLQKAADPEALKNYLATTQFTPEQLAEVTGYKVDDLASARGASQQEFTQDYGYSPEQMREFRDWQGAQYNPMTGGTVGETWQRDGVDPYSDPNGLRIAAETMSAGYKRLNDLQGAGENVTALGVTPWADPTWRSVHALEQAAQAAQVNNARNNPGKFASGPGAAPTAQASTLDPQYASALGGADPVTALRAANILKYGKDTDANDPAAVALAQKLGPKYQAQAATKAASTSPSTSQSTAGVAGPPSPGTASNPQSQAPSQAPAKPFDGTVPTERLAEARRYGLDLNQLTQQELATFVNSGWAGLSQSRQAEWNKQAANRTANPNLMN